MDMKKKVLCVALLGTILGFWHEAIEPAEDRHPHTHQEAPALGSFRPPHATIVASGTLSSGYEPLPRPSW